MREDNRGITFVELIIAMAISVMIMGAATVFIGTSVKGYQNASDNIDVQTDTQMLMEQIATWTMEGNGVKIESGMLVIYNIPRKADSSAKADKRVIWLNHGNLYTVCYKRDLPLSGKWSDDTTTLTFISSEEKPENLLCENVQSFIPSLDTTSDNPTVSVTLSLKKGKDKYDLTDKFVLRNEWLLQ